MHFGMFLISSSLKEDVPAIRKGSSMREGVGITIFLG